jgi:serine/threonine protein phosphatase PrpC
VTQLRSGAATDVGLVRNVNQDHLLVAAPLFAVADGMGGHAAGEVASLTALEALRAAFEGRHHPDGDTGTGDTGTGDTGTGDTGTGDTGTGDTGTGDTGAGDTGAGDTGAGDTGAGEVGAGEVGAGDGAGPSGVDGIAGAVRAANRAVWEEAQANPDFRGMGTTLTAIALLGGDGRSLAVANVGDSRTYRLRNDTFEQLTVDHNLVSELVAEGQIGEEEAETHPQRHVLTRALGVSPEVDVDVITTEPEPGDRYLLCSDGLSREVADSQIASVLRRLADPDDAARELVAEAKLHGGNDNITVVVVDVLVDGAAPEGAEAAGPAVADPVEAEGKGRPGVLAGGEPALTRSERRAARRTRKPDARPRRRIVTLRVVGFFLLLVAVVGLGAAGTAWYARSGYFVGLRGDRITIFQGRPGGLLFWKPTVKQVTVYTTAAVESYHLSALKSGVQEASLAAAQHFVANLRSEAVVAGVDPSAPAPKSGGTS